MKWGGSARPALLPTEPISDLFAPSPEDRCTRD